MGRRKQGGGLGSERAEGFAYFPSRNFEDLGKDSPCSVELSPRKVSQPLWLGLLPIPPRFNLGLENLGCREGWNTCLSFSVLGAKNESSDFGEVYVSDVLPGAFQGYGRSWVPIAFNPCSQRKLMMSRATLSDAVSVRSAKP